MSALCRADPRAQDRRIERLWQIVVGAELDALRNLVGVRVGADHDDRNISLIWIALDDFENLVPVQIRHHQIEEDETELFLFDQRNCLVSASRAGDPLVAIGFEHQLQRVAIILIVIDDEDTGEIRCHEHLEVFSICGSDGRRWLWPKAAIEGQRSSEWTYFSRRFQEFISRLTHSSRMALRRTLAP